MRVLRVSLKADHPHWQNTTSDGLPWGGPPTGFLKGGAWSSRTDVYLRNSFSRGLRGFSCELSRMQGTGWRLGRNTVSPGCTAGMTCSGTENLSTSFLANEGAGEPGISRRTLSVVWREAREGQTAAPSPQPPAQWGPGIKGAVSCHLTAMQLVTGETGPSGLAGGSGQCSSVH